jgi:hypothetical protein
MALTPYRKIDGEWITNAKPIRVRRVMGEKLALSLVPRHGYASLITSTELAFVEQVARKRGWKLEVKYAPIIVPRFRWLDGDMDCNRDLLHALNRVGQRLGKSVFIRSGRRTIAEQQALWDKYGPPRAARPNPNAPHVRGVAADCGIDGIDIGNYPGAREAMKAEGVSLRVPGEPWHAELGDVWNA